MDMVLKIAQHSAHHGDWSYYAGFDHAEKEDNWFIYLESPAKVDKETGVGQGPVYVLKHETPGREPMEHQLDHFAWFVNLSDKADLEAGKIKRLHVSRIVVFRREPEGAYSIINSFLCNTAAFILNGTGTNIDRLV